MRFCRSAQTSQAKGCAVPCKSACRDTSPSGSRPPKIKCHVSTQIVFYKIRMLLQFPDAFFVLSLCCFAAAPLSTACLRMCILRGTALCTDSASTWSSLRPGHCKVFEHYPCTTFWICPSCHAVRSAQLCSEPSKLCIPLRLRC